MSDDTETTADGPDWSTDHDTDDEHPESTRAFEDDGMTDAEFEDAHQKNIERAAAEVDREPRRVELELPDELGVYDSIRHRNGDETFLFLSSFGEGYQALAYDINAAGEILETEIVGHAKREERAVSMCEYWMQANDGGVLGATENPNAGSGGENIVDKIGAMFGGGK